MMEDDPSDQVGMEDKKNREDEVEKTKKMK